MNDVTSPGGELVDFIALDRLDEARFQATSHQPNHLGGVYGGCLLAQALRAAELTAPDYQPHSLHAHFLRMAVAAAPIEYEVLPTRSGGSYATRRVVGRQDGRPVAEATISLQTPREGARHERGWEPPPPPPESTATLEDFLAGAGADISPEEAVVARRFAQGLETRLLNPEDFFLRRSAPAGGLWIRPRAVSGRLSPSPFASLAFVSDYLMPAACNMPHIRSTYDPSMLALSLDHTLWLHAAPDAGAWMFYDIESPWAGSGRGLSLGRLYSEHGRLLATSAQEQMIRFSAP